MLPINPRLVVIMIKNLLKYYLFFLAFCPVFGSDYYVSKTGNNLSADGSKSSPFQTLTEAVKHLSAGDNCYIKEGIYRETLNPTTSGTQSAPIHIKAVQGEKVVLSAFDIIAEWTEYSENIYVADISDSITQLFIDNKFANQASFPNLSADLFNRTTFPISSMTETEVASSSLNQTADHWKGATIWAMLGYRWISQVATITSSSPGVLKVTGNTWAENTGDGIGYITGCKAALDTAGEWHYEDGKLYLQLAPSDHPSNHLIEAKKRKWVIDLDNRSHVTISGISTIGGAVSMNKSSGCVLDSMNMSYLSHFVRIESGGSSWLRHDWTNINYDGIGVGIFGSKNSIKNSEIAWSAGDGVTMFGSDNRIENCIIHDCNYSGTDCNPVTANGVNHVITRSTIYNGGRGIICFSFTQKATITYNNCYNPGLLNMDVGIIFAWGTDAKGTTIAHNWVHDNILNGVYKIGIGIYIDNYCSDIIIHHNVVWNCSYNAFNYSRPAKNIFYYNNTAFNAPDIDQSYLPDKAEDTSSGNRMYNNLCEFNIAEFPMLEKCNNLHLVSLPLRNTVDYDFRLADNAVEAIDAGMFIHGITDNYHGKGPDIGAYEHGGIFWKAGAGTVDSVPLTIHHEKAIKKTEKNVFIYKCNSGEITFFINRSFNGSIILLDMQGKVAGTLYEGRIGTGLLKCRLNPIRLSSGIYILKVFDSNNITSYSDVVNLIM